jgi:HAD superfamily hydrolase (TIGR01509 family)
VAADRPGRPRVVIFDVDGTLIDSNDAHAASWVDTLAEAGHDVPFERIRLMIGMGGDKLLPTATGIEVDSPEGERLTSRRAEIFHQRYLPTLRALPGARALLERLGRDGRTLVIATSAKREELDAMLRQVGLDGLFEEETSSSDAERSKPDPDIVEAALRRAGVPPDECVMLGDTPYDVEASQRAGVAIIGVRSGGWTAEELAGAVEVWDGPADLLEHYERSALAHGAPAVTSITDSARRP